MTTGTPPVGVLPHRYIPSLLLKNSFLTVLRFIEIIMRNLKFDAKAYFT